MKAKPNAKCPVCGNRMRLVSGRAEDGFASWWCDPCQLAYFKNKNDRFYTQSITLDQPGRLEIMYIL